MGKLWQKLKEASTWRGIVWLVTAGGVVLSDLQIEAIISAGMALTGLIDVFKKDKK